MKQPDSSIHAFIAPVSPSAQRAYVEHAAAAAAIFREHGASRVVFAWGDDVPVGERTDFHRAVGARDDEVVVLSWHEYPSREVAERAMSDARVQTLLASGPFDATRMIHGTFSRAFELGAARGTEYVDGSILAVPARNEATYREVESRQAAVILEHGATRALATWDGGASRFATSVHAGAEEAVALSVVEWASKDVRDAAWQRVLADPRMYAEQNPYDNTRRVHGGFTLVLDV